jgi:hypothetical protein
MGVGNLNLITFFDFWVSMGVGELIDEPKKTGCKSTVFVIKRLKRWESGI